MNEQKKETIAVTMAELLELLKNGVLTINEARERFGFEKIDDPNADKLFTTVR